MTAVAKRGRGRPPVISDEVRKHRSEFMLALHADPEFRARRKARDEAKRAKGYVPRGPQQDPWERFWSYVHPEPNTGCWFWTGALSRGYGAFKARSWTMIPAHRFSYEYLVGPIPEELQLDHLCRMPCCVNPDHLEPVTGAVNVWRSPLFNGNKTHCPQGHPYAGENLKFHKDGRRRCNECNTLNSREFRRRNTAKRLLACMSA